MWVRTARRRRRHASSSHSRPRKSKARSEPPENKRYVSFAPEQTKNKHRDKQGQQRHHHRSDGQRHVRSRQKTESEEHAGGENSSNETILENAYSKRHAGNKRSKISTAPKLSRFGRFAMHALGLREPPKGRSGKHDKATATIRTTRTTRTTKASGATKASGETKTNRSGSTGVTANLWTKPAVRHVARPKAHTTVDARAASSSTTRTGREHTTRNRVERENRTPRDTKRVRRVEKHTDQNDEVTDLVRLGEGGFGEVWKGKHVKYGDVAIKRVKTTDSKKKKMAEKELRLSGKISGHPNIIQFHEGFSRTMDGVPYLVLIFQYAPGGDLKERIDRKTLSEDNKKFIIRGSLKGLRHIHGMNLVHGDIKPQNILLMSSEGKDITERDVKLIDFGLTESIPTGCTVVQVSGIHAEIHYMAPEGWDCIPNYSMDMWALGVTLYEMYNGMTSFPVTQPHPDDHRPLDVIAEAILSLKDVWNKPGWSNSGQAKSLCQKMLETNYGLRISVKDALLHLWLKVLKA